MPPVRFILAGLLLLSGPALADSLSVEVLEFGQMRGEPASGERDPALRDDTLAGVQPIARPRILQQGGALRLRYCDGFGLVFKVHGIPPGGTAVIQVRNAHPTLTRPDGVSGSVDLYDIRVSADPSWVGFTYSESWSLVPGRWTITLEYEGRTLAERAFDIVKSPEPGTLEANGCATPIS